MRTACWYPVTRLVATVVLALGCQPAGSNRPHVSLSATADELRDAFNADMGRVRVVMLVAPT